MQYQLEEREANIGDYIFYLDYEDDYFVIGKVVDKNNVWVILDDKSGVRHDAYQVIKNYKEE